QIRFAATPLASTAEKLAPGRGDPPSASACRARLLARSGDTAHAPEGTRAFRENQSVSPQPDPERAGYPVKDRERLTRRERDSGHRNRATPGHTNDRASPPVPDPPAPAVSAPRAEGYFVLAPCVPRQSGPGGDRQSQSVGDAQRPRPTHAHTPALPRNDARTRRRPSRRGA